VRSEEGINYFKGELIWISSFRLEVHEISCLFGQSFDLGWRNLSHGFARHH
jgi:hypothetical protein